MHQKFVPGGVKKDDKALECLKCGWREKQTGRKKPGCRQIM